MSEMALRNKSAEAVCEWLSGGFDRNWSSNQQHPYVMLTVDLDTAVELPDDVMAWSERSQSSPTARPVYVLPAGILAKHYLGHPIPSREETEEYRA